MPGGGDDWRGPWTDADRSAHPRKEYRFFVGRTDAAIQDRDVGTGGLHDRRDVPENGRSGGQEPVCLHGGERVDGTRSGGAGRGGKGRPRTDQIWERTPVVWEYRGSERRAWPGHGDGAE